MVQSAWSPSGPVGRDGNLNVTADRYVRQVKITAQVKLVPTPEQAAALAATLQTANQAANWLSTVAFSRQITSRQALQKLAYREVKARGLSAQPALHVIDKVANAYTTLAAKLRAGNLGKPDSIRHRKATSNPIRFRPDAAQPYDDRSLSWQLDAGTVSIWTVHGRLKGVPFICSEETRELLAAHRQGETDLVHRDGLWLLAATCEVPEAPPLEPAGFLGVDLGIVNIATTSDGVVYAGRKLNRYRRRQLELRTKLQRKKTKSARRLLKRQRRKEARRVRDTNHVISSATRCRSSQVKGARVGTPFPVGDRDRSPLPGASLATAGC
jgi:putative transposase